MLDSQSEACQTIDRDNELHEQLRDLCERLPRLTGAERQAAYEQREAVLDELDVRTEERAKRRRGK